MQTLFTLIFTFFISLTSLSAASAQDVVPVTADTSEDQLTEVVDRLSIPVLCFGLRTDFQGELFEGSTHLLAWADELNEIKTICHTVLYI